MSRSQQNADYLQQQNQLGYRNVLINGKFAIDQRNAFAAQTITAGAALAYTADRWYAYCTGANVTGQVITVSSAKRYQFTGLASNTGVGFGQRIEAANSLHLAGSTVTLSARLSSSSLTSITWTAYYANTTDTFGTLASPTRTQFATGSFTINSTEATYSATFAVSASATTGIEIVFTGGALLGSQTLTIGNVQLEVGNLVTPFEHRPYGMELALCQRYYYRRVGTDWTGSVQVSTSTLMFVSQLPVSLRNYGTASVVLNSNIVNANYVNTAATGTSWTLTTSNVGYATKTGTVTLSPYVAGDLAVHLILLGASWSISVATLNIGSGAGGYFYDVANEL